MIRILSGPAAWEFFKERVRTASEEDAEVARVVREILVKVRTEGDTALRALAESFGDPVQGSITLGENEIRAAMESVPQSSRQVLERAAGKIRAFAQAVTHALHPLRTEFEGYAAGMDFKPVETVGCYVPGGRFPLPSSALMTAVTARAAGVERICMACPDPTPEVVYAGMLAGVDRIYRCGGAQAIAALAFGTETVSPVDMIVGPGNAYVTEAKRQVQGRVGIDMLAGPSEIAVIADGGADPGWIALDLLAQWEHDPRSEAWLFTDSPSLAEKVARELERRIIDPALPAFIRRSVESAAILVFQSLEECGAASDLVAPEHLELAVARPGELKAGLRHYGALFMGYRTTVPFGDYMAGPNHTLPTGRSARFSGGLSPLSFLRSQTWIEVHGGAKELIEDTAAFAGLEGLPFHGEAARARGEADPGSGGAAPEPFMGGADDRLVGLP